MSGHLRKDEPGFVEAIRRNDPESAKEIHASHKKRWSKELDTIVERNPDVFESPSPIEVDVDGWGWDEFYDEYGHFQGQQIEDGSYLIDAIALCLVARHLAGLETP